MKTVRLEIGQTLAFESVKYDCVEGSQPPHADAYFEFTEHSKDHWHTDSQTTVDVDEQMAQKIISALVEHFQLKNVSIAPINSDKQGTV